MLLHARFRFAKRYLGTDMLHLTFGPLAALRQVVPDTNLFAISGLLHGFHQDPELRLLILVPVLVPLWILVGFLDDFAVFVLVLIFPLNEVLCP